MNRTLILLLAFTFALVGNDAIEAKTYYVRKSGNDNNAGTRARSAFQTIGHAAKIASAGDTIIIGSGTYDEDVRWDKPPQGNRFCIFYGDPDGIFTGDKGGVTWRPQAYTALFADSSGGLIIENIDFKANPASSKTQTALKFYRNLGRCYAEYCTFTDVYYGIENNFGYASCNVQLCTFSNVTYGVKVDNAYGTELLVNKCDIATTRFGVATAGAKAVYIANSSISAYNGVGNVKGVDATDCFLAVMDTTVTGANVGVRGTNVSVGYITGCTFVKNTLYSTELTGENLSVENTSFNDCYYGVKATETNGNWIYLDQVQFNGNFRGVVSNSGNYWCTNTTFTDCTTGWYVLSARDDVTIAGNGSVSFKNCTYGISANKAANVEPTLYVDSVICEDCAYGINAGNVNSAVNKCKFVCKTFGFYTSGAPQTKVSNCVFRGESDSNRCIYGCYARSDQTNISDTKAELCNTGMYIYNLTDTPPVFQNVGINDCRGNGIIVYNGVFKWTGNDALSITNCNTGLARYNGEFIADGVTHGATCNRGILLHSTNSTISNCNLTADSMAVYQYLGDTISISGTTIHDCSGSGLYVYNAKKAKYTDCTFTRCGTGSPVYSTSEIQLEMSGVAAVDNNSSGIYLYNAHVAGSIKNCRFENNTYGIYAHTSPLDIDGEDNVSFTGNNQAISAIHSKVKLANMAIKGNQYGVNVNLGSVDAQNLDLENEAHNIYVYATAECNIDNCRINGGSTGISIYPKTDYDGVTSVTRTQIAGTTSTGLYYKSAPSFPSATLRVADCSFQSLSNALKATNTTVNVFNMIAEDVKATGISFESCNAQVSNSRVLRCGIYGYYGYGSSVSLDRVQIGQMQRYAIYSRDDKIVVTNSLVHDYNDSCVIAGQSDDSQVALLQSTFANTRSSTVTISRGQGTVTNCILHSLGLNALSLGTSPKVSHSNNIIYAAKYKASTPAAFQHEIVKDPLFVNAAASDFRLQIGSPAINAGIELAGINSTDWDGNQRPSFNGYEIGAFEYMKSSGSLRVLAWEEMARQD